MSLLQSIIALVPIIWIIVALTALKMPGHWACLSAMVIAIVLALTMWKMPAVGMATSALEGFLSALWPIILVIIAAIFTYNLSLRSGAMDVIKRMLTGISADKRIIILLIGWCFGGFLEGMAGFGTAIAIPASMLAGMGMNPVLACLVCMLANAFPTAFGSVGIPTTTLISSTAATFTANFGGTGLVPTAISFTTIVQMAPFMILVPFLMIIVGGGGPKALKGVVGITLVSGISFLIPELIVSKFIGPELTVIVGCIVSLLCTILMARARKGKPVPAEYDMRAEGGGAAAAAKEKQVDMKPIIAWLPFILIFVFLLLTSKLVPPINTFLGQFKTSVIISTMSKTKTTFSWINTPGVLIFIAAIIGGIAQHISGRDMLATLGATFKQMVKTIITIMSVMAMAKIMTFSGMIGDMAKLFVTLTGKFYPFVAPIIAAIGAFVTGSGTNTEVLLGSLQVQAAKAINVSPYWLAAANSLGAGIGKIMSPQCIATAVAAVGLEGQDSKLLKGIFKWAILLLVIACLVVGLLQGIAPSLIN
ncbi:MAG: L-lactate permease [Oscillospiraceae bacterium]|nr:L-lactate permease [Oscillospiraceae bacterium]MDD3261099.1 lactate permease LctP family transporter [Oscillospiraceae bacterium]